MRRSLIPALLLVGHLAPPAASAYPISPRTLWAQAQTAELVVLAEVESAGPPELRQLEAEAQDEDWPLWTARLRVVEVWKGEAPARLEVGYPGYLICPAPPRYEKGRQVIAFLSREDGVWRTEGLSYGTLYPRLEEVAVFRELVARSLEIPRLPRRLRTPAKLSWAVDAAADPATRWHGLYELESESDSLRSSYDQRQSRQRASKLTTEHRARIAAGFIDGPRVDHTFSMVLSVLAGYRSEELDHAALAALETALAGEHVPYWIGEAMAAVLTRFGDEHAERRVAKLTERCWDLDPEAARRLWRDAKRELKLPDAKPLLDAWQPIVFGVGGRTPS